MNLYHKIRRSLSFRYRTYKNKRRNDLLAKLKNQHKDLIEKAKIEPFTIISSNCWGGAVYEDLEREYLTPTIGLYFFAPDFIAFLKNQRERMDEKISFTEHSKYSEVNEHRNREFAYPVGVFKDGVEIQFLHYKTREEAFEKWERRKKRINWDRLFIACTDRDRMTPELMKEYDALPFENKVLFTAQEHPEIRCAVQIKAFADQKEVGDLYHYRFFVSKDFDINKFLNPGNN